LVPRDVVQFFQLFLYIKTSIALPFQLFRRALLEPEFADILPTDATPFLKDYLQIIQIFRFQKILLGGLLKYRKALGGRSEELLKSQLLA